jgi:hypothetical protein
LVFLRLCLAFCLLICPSFCLSSVSVFLTAFVFVCLSMVYFTMLSIVQIYSTKDRKTVTCKLTERGRKAGRSDRQGDIHTNRWTGRHKPDRKRD